MNEDLIKDKLYEIKDQFNKRKMIPAKFYLYIQTKYIHFRMEMVEGLRYCSLMMTK